MKLSQPVAPAQLQTVFILKPEEVKKLAHRGEKNGRISFWLQPKECEEYRDDEWKRLVAK